MSRWCRRSWALSGAGDAAGAAGRPRRGHRATVAARSAGLEMPHCLSDRQPQPMHESSLSRNASRAATCSSSRVRQCVEMRCQSDLVGVRLAGSWASSARISSRVSPTLLAARMKASRRSTLRA